MDGVGRLGLAGVVTLAILMAVAVGDAWRDDGATEASPADALVEAWHRSRTATYHASGTFERSRPGGNRLEVDVEIAQRPPDRLVRQFGEVSGYRRGRALECPAPLGDDPLECRPGRRAGPYEAVVAREVARFAALVTGPDPLYEVRSADPGCWEMTRTRNDPRSGFGLEATICVDERTGAVRSIVVDHGAVDERTVYDDISTEVTDEDLEP